MEPGEILSRSSQVGKDNTVVRRTLGLDMPVVGGGAVNLHVFAGGRAVVWVDQKRE
jgi:hypothetical protein